MKELVFLSAIMVLVSCDDGDLQIEQVDFDEVNIQSCPGLEDTTETTFFYKIDGDEALLLNLAEGLINNETSEPGTIASTVPETSNLIYRLFSDDVSQAYFCDAIPPLEPVVIKENLATAGNISIETQVDTLTASDKVYAHAINIDGLSLENDQGEQLTDLTTLEYGTFITQTENSARLTDNTNLPVPFSNYAEVGTQLCAPAPLPNTIRVYKALNDEFIALDVPQEVDIFKNEVTPDTTSRVVVLKDKNIFKYVVLNTLVDNTLACTATFGEDVEAYPLVSKSGKLRVRTVAAEPAADNSITYTHTITLENLILTSKATETTGKDVDLPELSLVDWGTYSTRQEF